MPKRRPLIRYTSRDYASIRRDLLEYTKRYYPNTYRDFSETSFGSLMIDSVSYIGDILSFYLDYQTNESFLDTAIEYNNVIRLGKQLGYKYSRNHSSFGTVFCYVVVPASSEGLGPDRAYIPTLKRGTTFSTSRGTIFTLISDIDFSFTENMVVVAEVDSDTGVPINYAIKAPGQVMSGDLIRKSINVGAHEKFKKIAIDDNNITEIVSVFDSAGNQYFEVDYLSQNIIYKETFNPNSDSNVVSKRLKEVVVPRRFTVENETNQTFLQFGYGSSTNLTEDVVTDPSRAILDLHGRTYSSDASFDPSKLNQTDKFGVAPANTTLLVTYRKNGEANVNVSAGALSRVASPKFRFLNRSSLVGNSIDNVVSSLEVENEKPITGDVSLPSVDEIRTRIYSNFATQHRAVTREDYKAMVYSMPAKFGAIKRCNVRQDKDSFKRNLNLYVVSNLRNGQLSLATSTLKQNLKTWINRYKMINDTVDILDAKIVNLRISFELTANRDFDKQIVLNSAISNLGRHFATKMEIGEPFIVSDISNTLSKIEGVSSVDSVDVENISSAGYSSTRFNIKQFTSANGKEIFAPLNVVFEVKRPLRDISGVVK